ncbi:MAG: ComF family protein [Geobacter sp.]|nr:ComF family protein [Geobacter sp.]
MQRCWARLVDCLFPPLCHCCREPLRDSRKVRLCDSCLAGVTPLESPLCPLCGQPYLHASCSDHLCGACTLASPSFDSARGALLFDGPVRELIHQFKYSGKTMLRRPLALLAADHLGQFVSESRPDMIIPVPLHKKRLRQRGFNQAILLGEIFAKRWELPLLRNTLRRVRWTEPQVNLSAVERLENVKGAFAISGVSDFSGKRILLVDDVYTTGSTVKECAKILKHAGAEAVNVVTVARAAD